MEHVFVAPRAIDGLRDAITPDRTRRLEVALDRMCQGLGSQRMWHVNSTATGGGVAEILSTLLPYAVGAGVPVGWLVLDGNPEFYEITKRVHNRLHESAGDGGPLGTHERAVYTACLDHELVQLTEVVEPGDVVVLHDPQTVGLTGGLQRHGARVAWRCHIGVDAPGSLAASAWDFLGAEVASADAYVFSRLAHVWPGLDPGRVVIMPPCIDVLSSKNQHLDDTSREAILQASGLITGGRTDHATPSFRSRDGEVRQVARRARMVEDVPVPGPARLVTQVSRWDRLKDPVGVLNGFAGMVAESGDLDDVHLVLAGPEVEGVDDDPEGAEILAEVQQVWAGLPPATRRRAHLACLPMDDVEENGAMVNALQRHADVVVQKSLAEGFGLTVAEAMWKRRAVVASRVGGMQDQIVDGESGLLLDDPDDLGAFSRAVAGLLADRARAEDLGVAAHERVCENYLPVHHFVREAELIERLSALRQAGAP